MDPFKFPKTRHIKINLDKINPEIIQLFDNLGLHIFLAEVFYSRPFFVSGIHTDVKGGDINKINWVFGGNDSIMNWYAIKEGTTPTDVQQTVVGTPYIAYDSAAVHLEFSKTISNPCLVHVGVPHNICNAKEHRWCVSLVYHDKKSKKRPTMEEAKNIFRDYCL
jgi:hypothetical protein